MSLPANAVQLDKHIGAVFWAMDYTSYWLALVHADGKVALHKRANNQWTTLWEAVTNNLVQTGPTDVNSVRAILQNGTVTVIVNGQTVKSVRARFPSGDLKFGLFAEYNKTSTAPILYSVRSYKVTSVE